jgi:hypothetical protein
LILSSKTWAELEEGEGSDCEYIFSIQVKIEAESFGSTAATSFTLEPLGGESLIRIGLSNEKYLIEDTLRAAVCMKSNEKVHILRTYLSVVAMGFGHIANAWQEANVISVFNNGSCKLESGEFSGS